MSVCSERRAPCARTKVAEVRRRPFRSGRCASAVALLGLVLGACGGDDDGGVPVAFSVVADPGGSSEFRTTGVDDAITYGFGQLVGSTVVMGESVEAELLGSVAYLNGSGPFSGFWTLTFPDGAEIVFEYSGKTVRSDSESVIKGSLRVLGGSGRFSSVTGGGSVVGERVEAVGSAVDYTFSLNLGGLTT